MHREIRDHIEDVLAGPQPVSRPSGGTLKDTREHLAQCDECRSEVRGMQQQTALIRELRAPEDFAADLRPGFYARVMERRPHIHLESFH
jgi:predicted anti-sigma-YlaC factor YlaD